MFIGPIGNIGSLDATTTLLKQLQKIKTYILQFLQMKYKKNLWYIDKQFE